MCSPFCTYLDNQTAKQTASVQQTTTPPPVGNRVAKLPRMSSILKSSRSGAATTSPQLMRRLRLGGRRATSLSGGRRGSHARDSNADAMRGLTDTWMLRWLPTGHFHRFHGYSNPQAYAQQRWVAAADNSNSSSSSSSSSTTSGQPSTSEPTGRKIGVLFVCLGNICRSPAAEAMFRSVVSRAGLANHFNIASCGTGGGNPDWYTQGGWSYHEGDPSDERMARAAYNRGINIICRSKPLKPSDLLTYDYIIGMDAKNERAVVTAAKHWATLPDSCRTVDIPESYRSKLSLMTQYCSKYAGASEVPDPYYGGADGFERVLDLLEDACTGLLDRVRRDHGGLQ